MKMNSQKGSMVRKVFTAVAVIALSMMLVACGGKKKVTQSNGEPIVDITRPPVMINDIKTQTVESDPDEVISYEKWTQQRAEEQAKDATNAKQAEAEQETGDEPK